jgi:hypothetical protein
MFDGFTRREIAGIFAAAVFITPFFWGFTVIAIIIGG